MKASRWDMAGVWQTFATVRAQLHLAAFERENHYGSCDRNWGGCSCEKSGWLALDRIQAEHRRLISRIQATLARDFAAHEDLATLHKLDALHAYERGVLDVQEYLATPPEEDETANRRDKIAGPTTCPKCGGDFRFCTDTFHTRGGMKLKTDQRRYRKCDCGHLAWQHSVPGLHETFSAKCPTCGNPAPLNGTPEPTETKEMR